MDDIRKRLLFRATHRGMQETDHLIGGFAKARLPDLDQDQLTQFGALLEESDGHLLYWITGREPIPERFDHPLMVMIIDFSKSL
ncbi:MAG: succinate dehydrogenase assembly factor 2 [Rhodospirillales bacterium]|jgi:antitoxin CptB|nr:succinate dehydrogenase assembly factor 2 [Rhodospirillales bacterium]